MSLTQAQMDWLDEQPTQAHRDDLLVHRGGSGAPHSLPLPAWKAAAQARARRLKLMAYELEKEKRKYGPL